ncbi:MAG: HlyD family efflux transporter periplasmic adaptor subunit [Phycisphaeraceae bacterium]
MPGWLRKTLTVVVLLALAGLIVWAFVPTPEPVEVARVARGALRVAVEDEGQTRVRDRYTVAAPIAGRMQRIELDPGDVVEAGERLAVIAPPAAAALDVRARDEAAARVEAARANVARTGAEVARVEVELAYAQRERDRIDRLVAADAAPERQLDEARVLEQSRQQMLEAAQWTRQIAEHELTQARAALQTYPDGPSGGGDRPLFEVVAPARASVLRVHERSERYVMPGAVLLELGDVSGLEIVLDVLSDDASRIAAGQAAQVIRYADQRAWPARVRLVEPAAFTEVSALGVDEQRVNVILDFADDAQGWGELGDAYRVDVRVITWEAEDVLLMPTSALFREGEDRAVFRVIDGRARRQLVEVGRQSGQQTQVIAGLDEGDAVVLYPTDRIEDGTRVEPRQ